MLNFTTINAAQVNTGDSEAGQPASTSVLKRGTKQTHLYVIIMRICLTIMDYDSEIMRNIFQYFDFVSQNVWTPQYFDI